LLEKNYFLDNCYPQVVTAGGNKTAQRYLQETMSVNDANWRGVGSIANSGYTLRNSVQDAKVQFPTYATKSRKRVGEMPAGCDCAKVVLGNIYPNECQLYGTACTPRQPIGPCMVSDEGACRIWWSGGIKTAIPKN
jgi:hydrogenase expression/formation protein HypD